MTALAYILWCGCCWVMRGGWFGQIVRDTLGFEPGTTITRIACAGAMVAPLAYLLGAGWAMAAAMWFTVWLAMTLGYFGESMGIERGARDVLLMMLWGATVAAVALSGVMLTGALWFYLADCLPVYFEQVLPGYGAAIIGALAGPIYALNKPLGRRWGWDWTERSEAMTGCAIGAALWFGANWPSVA